MMTDAQVRHDKFTKRLTEQSDQIEQLELASLELTQQLKDLAAQRMADMDKVRAEMALRERDEERSGMQRAIAEQGEIIKSLQSQLATERAGRVHEGERADRLREKMKEETMRNVDVLANAHRALQLYFKVRESRARLVRLVRRMISPKVYSRVFVERNEARNELAKYRAEGYTMVLNHVKEIADLQVNRDTFKRAHSEQVRQFQLLQADFETIYHAVAAWVAQSDSIAAREALLKVWQGMEAK